MLSSLRRRGDWLELRLACQHPAPPPRPSAVGWSPPGRPTCSAGPVPDLPVAGGALRLDLRAWEIRTVQLRLDEEGP